MITKNRLALYLGCQVLVNDVVWTLVGVCPSEVEPERMIAIIDHPHFGQDEAYVEECRLVLRRLKDITVEERVELFYAIYPKGTHGLVWAAQMDFTGVWLDIDPDGPSNSSIYDEVGAMSIRSHAVGIAWLLSKGFDLFDLIDSGNAVDRATIEEL